MKTNMLKKALLAGVSALSVMLAGCGIPYSDGVRVGTVQKVSNKGLIWRTFEGELVMDGFTIKGNANRTKGTDVWTFSAQDKAVVSQLEKAAEGNQRVKLTYEQKLFPAPWQSGTSYIVTKVEAAL